MSPPPPPPPPPSPAAPPPPFWSEDPSFLIPAILSCFILGSLCICCVCSGRRELNIPIDDIEAQRNHPQQPHPPPNYNPNQDTAAKKPPLPAEKKASSFRYTKNQAIAANTDSECSVCLGEFKDGEKCRQLECEHTFHGECIDQWLLKKMHCPLCRATVSSVQL
ncbi:Hypothetical predicted protein [Prunus dulcis]|uniref:RING-type domain-containing protein n=1 Tax=Prunus dulcis TaxID=3755 RepID=A0A5E4F5D3_PRUDU|nr:Hypothetical predicted protein [Prunus dulcis]